MGTPRECDEFPDAAEDHLIAEGGHFARSPRAFARGRYEGREGIILHLRRRCDEGTFFHVDLKIGDEDICHAVLDMTYPYGLAKSVEKHAVYENIWRETRIDQKSGCRTWMGFGYTANSGDYVDCAEHIFPVSVGYGYHSNRCAKNFYGEWNWCSDRSGCGRKVWMLELSVLDRSEGRLAQEKLTLTLTYVLFNPDDAGRQRAEIFVAVDGVVKGSVLLKDKEDAKLGHYDKSRLQQSAALFVASRRHLVRKPHPPHTPAYLRQVFQPPQGFPEASKIPSANGDTEAMFRCLVQLIANCDAFNLTLLTQVLYDQVSEEAPSWNFVEGIHRLFHGVEQEGTMTNAIMHLGDLPAEELPYTDLGQYPALLRLLLQLLMSLRTAVAWGKDEKEIRNIVRKTFEMHTTWLPLASCGVCGVLPSQKPRWHFPVAMLPSPQRERVAPVDIVAALEQWIEGPTVMHPCDREARCRYLLHNKS